jgi:hypothetical protein
MAWHAYSHRKMVVALAGEVTGELRLPYSTNRGFQFGTHGPGTRPRTVRLPRPLVGYAVREPVSLDGVYLPQALSNHHAASTWQPPKRSFEGDSMMLVEDYRCALRSCCAALDPCIAPEYELTMRV